MAPYPDRLSPGSPYPLGATWDGLGTNFAVFSAHAERMDLCLFDPSGKRQVQSYQLPECTDEIWHGYLPNARAVCSTAIAPMAHTSRRMGIGLIITSSCSIPMRGASPAISAGRTRCLGIG